MNDTLKNYIAYIEENIMSFIPVSDKNDYAVITEAMKYSCSSGGKRIRPVLCLEFCRVCSGDYRNALSFACGVEFIHTYSLIHDDLPCMDNDDFRRGKPSSHKKYGEAMALLAGDSLLTHAFTALVSDEKVDAQKKVRAVDYLSRFAGVNGMIGGQVVDILTEDKTADADTLFLMDKLKTSALIKSACVLGCIAAGAYDKIPCAEAFADNLGIAFQIVDDIIDFREGSENSDIVNGKATYVSYFGLEKAEKLADEYTQKAVHALDAFDTDTGFLKELCGILLKRSI